MAPDTSDGARAGLAGYAGTRASRTTRSLLVGHPDPPGLVERDRGGEADVDRVAAPAERAGADAVLVVAGEPQPVVLAGPQARDLHVDLGADRLGECSVALRARARPRRESRRACPGELEPPPTTSTSAITAAAAAANAAATDREPAPRPACAQLVAFVRDPVEDTARERGRTARPRPPVTFATGTGEQRLRDRGELAQLGPALGAAVEVRAQRRSPRPRRRCRARPRRARRAARGTDQSSSDQPNSSSARRIAFSA